MKELAAQTLEYFETKTRGTPKPDEDPDVFWTMKEYRPVWVREMVQAIHENGHFSPDDFKYKVLTYALELLADGQDPDEIEVEADVYTSDLLEWLASHLERAGYVDEAVENYGHADGIIGDITLGQWYEKDKITREVVQELHEELGRIALGEPQEMEDTSSRSKKGPKEWSPRDKKRRGK